MKEKMITKERIKKQMFNNLEKGMDWASNCQLCLEILCQEEQIKDIQDKNVILKAIMYYATEISGEIFGYDFFDLVLSRTFPNSETLRFIEEQEGKNIFQQKDE